MTAPICAELGIEVAFPALNAAQRQRRQLEAGASLAEIYGALVAETQASSASAGGPLRLPT